MMLRKIRSRIVHAKIFIQRANSYITIFNSGMILFLVLSRLENYRIDIRLERWFIPIFLLTLTMMLVFGYLEDRMGFYAEENLAQTKRNPALKEINARLERIEKSLKK